MQSSFFILDLLMGVLKSFYFTCNGLSRKRDVKNLRGKHISKKIYNNTKTRITMAKDTSDIWRWNAQLSWELFSEAIYCYRQTMQGFAEHKTHMFCKNGLFAIIASVEAYANEVLSKSPYNFCEKKLKDEKLTFKIKTLTKSSHEAEHIRRFNQLKEIRNDFLAHHKRKDQRYVIEINPISLLDAIESAQEIIAKIAFYNDLEFPCWISGVNFIDPRTKDIDLLNEVDFWRHIIMTGLFQCPNNFMAPSGSLNYPNLWDDYKILYDGLWQLLKDKNFDIDIGIKDSRFPHMPYLSCQYWD